MSVRPEVEFGVIALLKRNGLNPSLAQLLWLRYGLDAEAQTRDVPRVYVAYDDLVQQWRPAVQRITEGLQGLVFPRLSTSAVMDIDAFLSPELRHHSSATARATAPAFSAWVQEADAIFLRWSRGQEQPDDRERLDRLKSAFDAAASTFAASVR